MAKSCCFAFESAGPLITKLTLTGDSRLSDLSDEKKLQMAVNALPKLQELTLLGSSRLHLQILESVAEHGTLCLNVFKTDPRSGLADFLLSRASSSLSTLEFFEVCFDGDVVNMLTEALRGQSHLSNLSLYFIGSYQEHEESSLERERIASQETKLFKAIQAKSSI